MAGDTARNPVRRQHLVRLQRPRRAQEDVGPRPGPAPSRIRGQRRRNEEMGICDR